jgi:hypothetical protein
MQIIENKLTLYDKYTDTVIEQLHHQHLSRPNKSHIRPLDHSVHPLNGIKEFGRKEIN